MQAGSPRVPIDPLAVPPWTLSSRWAVSWTTRVAVRLVRLRYDRQAPVWAFVVATTLVFSVAPFAVFVVWMFQGEHRFSAEDYGSLRATMFVAGTWVIWGPALTTLWELHYLRSTSVWDEAAVGEGWRLDEIARSRNRVDKLYLPICWGFAAVACAAFYFAMEPLDALFATGDPSQAVWWVGFLVVGYIGWVSGNGVWGVVKTLSLARAITRSDVDYFPFRPSQVASLERLSDFVFTTALFFSVGSVFVPALWQASQDFAATAKFFVFLAVIVLLLGGFACFVLPIAMLTRLADQQRVNRLAEFSSAIETRYARVMEACNQELKVEESLRDELTSLLELRAAVAAESPVPVSQVLLVRAGQTVVVPAVMATAQLFIL